MAASLQERADALPWYHTIDLGDGVVTKGYVDTRRAAGRLPLPDSLAGKRCLDVGLENGFWAFELERRGADSVVGIDVDDPVTLDWPARARLTPGEGPGAEQSEHWRGHVEAFELAREALGSKVERVETSIYDLPPERLGEFDVVFAGSILLHLRDPVLALERMRSVCGGMLVLSEAFYPVGSILRPRTPVAVLDGTRPWWWIPNRAALLRMVSGAGFEIERTSRPYLVPPGPGYRRLGPRELLRAGPHGVFSHFFGFPHMAVLARPMAEPAGASGQDQAASLASSDFTQTSNE
ncbi:MAG: methyltransferase domain-containing protein [Thermoleophilaceae bacterium]